MTPFDGNKALYHVRYWEGLRTGQIPPPVLVTIDPTHRCNLQCDWCNSNGTIERNGAQLSAAQIADLPEALFAWGTRAVCIAGGGEPTLHPGLDELIYGLCMWLGNESVGLVTNGLAITRHLKALGRCRWVGVSVDAGRPDDYRAAKGVDAFGRVIGNIAALREAHPNLEITFKYLLHPGNLHGVYRAAELARDLRCTYFHARPAGVPWQHVSERRSLFSEGEVRQAVHLLNACAELSTDSFKVVNTPDKFAPVDWSIQHPFARCRAVGMTAVIQANGEVGLCCDRRGDPATKLCDWETPGDIVRAWGGPRHREILNSIDLRDCPRCTYAPHNRLFEQFAEGDATCKWFI